MSSETRSSSSSSSAAPIHNRGVRRPIVRFGEEDVPACPVCYDSVAGELGSPRVSTCRLWGQLPLEATEDVINVRGFLCRSCNESLALAPSDADLRVRETWIIVPVYSPGGSILRVLIPAGQIAVSGGDRRVD